MRAFYFISAFTFILSLASFSQDEIIVLKGGTIIDVDNYGKSTHDVQNSVVIIQGEKILAAGSSDKIKIPAKAKIIDVHGKFLVPGLIEGFGAITNQSFANAYLYMGVTTVVTSEDDRRGKTFTKASPSPMLCRMDSYWGADQIEATNKPYRYENVNYRDEARVKHDIDSMINAGTKVLLVHYGVKPNQLSAIVTTCKAHHVAVVGELGFTSYRDAVNGGVESFVHTSRYTADILPDSVRDVYSHAPFGPPASFYYSYISRPDILSDPRLIELAKLYSSHSIGLTPTGSLLEYPMMPFAKNPWKEPIASILDEKDIFHEPLDKATGKPKNPSPLRMKAAPIMFSIDSFFAHHGAHFLAGSGAVAFGTLPGISLHTELEVLSHIGLTNREVIAAATNNFSTFWRWTDIGKIEAGRYANILVLSADPLQDIEHLKDIEILFLQGKKIDRQILLKQ